MNSSLISTLMCIYKASRVEKVSQLVFTSRFDAKLKTDEGQCTGCIFPSLFPSFFNVQIWQKPKTSLRSVPFLQLTFTSADIWRVWPESWKLHEFTEKHDVFTINLILSDYTKVNPMRFLSTFSV